MLHAIVHAADIQDRDGGAMVMATLFGLYPFLLKLYADGGYQGPVFQSAMKSIMAQGRRDCQTIRSGQGFRLVAETLGSRTNTRMAQPVSSAGQRLGVPQSKGTSVSAPRINPPDGTKDRKKRRMIPCRL